MDTGTSYARAMGHAMGQLGPNALFAQNLLSAGNYGVLTATARSNSAILLRDATIARFYGQAKAYGASLDDYLDLLSVGQDTPPPQTAAAPSNNLAWLHQRVEEFRVKL